MNPLGRYGVLAVILIGLFLLVGWKNADPVSTQTLERFDSRAQETEPSVERVVTKPAKPAKPQNNAYRLPVPTTLKEVQARNRETLKKAPRWMDDDKVYESAIFHYGLPGFARPWINLDVGEDPTIPDLLGFMLVNLKNEHINYFEIGVSVGKCLFQMLEILGPASNVTAFDVEEINPSFADTLLDREDIKSWSAKSSMKPNGHFYRYNKGSSRPTFNYVSSDEFDQGGWLALVDQGLGPFDAIYSDAMHTPGALHDEWINIKEKNLLAITENRNWFMAWDDLGPQDMRDAVQGIMREIKEVAESRGLTAEYTFLKVNGWLGKNEGPHDVGVISNLPVKKLLRDAGLTLLE